MTHKQKWILTFLSHAGPQTTAELQEARQFVDRYETWDGVHSAMRRLENRELVRRVAFRPNKWEVTGAGREAVA